MKYLGLFVFIVAMNMGCRDAQIASRNISKAADNFEINRRIVFYNGITGEYILKVEGRCSIETEGGSKGAGTRRLSVICKTGTDQYKKHFLGLSDNVTFFSEQLEYAQASAYHYRVTFKPQAILPDLDFKGDAKELLENKGKQ